jgi:hypothetical protein
MIGLGIGKGGARHKVYGMLTIPWGWKSGGFNKKILIFREEKFQ